jgi:hypothetical protein
MVYPHFTMNIAGFKTADAIRPVDVVRGRYDNTLRA